MTSFEPAWNSLGNHAIPQRFCHARLGTYSLGDSSVPACDRNGISYTYNMCGEGTPQHQHHLNTHGHLSEYGNKDSIPMFQRRDSGRCLCGAGPQG